MPSGVFGARHPYYLKLQRLSGRQHTPYQPSNAQSLQYHTVDHYPFASQTVKFNFGALGYGYASVAGMYAGDISLETCL